MGLSAFNPADLASFPGAAAGIQAALQGLPGFSAPPNQLVGLNPSVAAAAALQLTQLQAANQLRLATSSAGGADKEVSEKSEQRRARR